MGKKAEVAVTRKMAIDLMRRPDGDISAPTDYLANLNVAGLDSKGSLSGSYAMAGLVGKVSASVDPLAAILPFVHLKAQVSAGGSCMASAFMTVQRMPRLIWGSQVDGPTPPEQTSPVPPPIWTCNEPLSLNYLRGRMQSFEAEAGVGIWAGLGNPKDVDETGLSVGAFVDGAITGSSTVLRCDAPLSFGSDPAGETLKNSIETLMEENIKRKVALWILANIGDIDYAEEHGAPMRRVGYLMQGLVKDLGSGAAAVVPEVVNASIAGFAGITTQKGTGITLSTDLSTLGRAFDAARDRVKKAFGSGGLETGQLLVELDGLEKVLTEQRDFYSQTLTLLAPAVPLDTAGRRQGVAGRSASEEVKLVDMRLDEIRELRDLLKKRRTNKQMGQADPVSRLFGDISGPPTRAGGHLRIVTMFGSASIDAKAKATASVFQNLRKSQDPAVRLFAEAGAKATKKRHSIKHQAVTAPGVSSRGNHPLVATADTTITHVHYALQARAGATAGARGGVASGEKRISSWVTMSYNSILMLWFDAPGKTSVPALRNGSGMSFGLSILRSRLHSYQRALKPDISAALTDPFDRATEATLLRQLRLTFTELRAFVTSIDTFHLNVDDAVDTRGEGDSYLIESAFGLTTPIDLTIKDHVAVDLKKLDAAKTLLETEPDFQTADWRGDTLALQSVRLRYRVTHASENRKGLLKLGLTHQKNAPDKPDLHAAEEMARRLGGVPLVEGGVVAETTLQALPVSFGLSAEWVTRVGMEGIVDIHTWIAAGEVDGGSNRRAAAYAISDAAYRTEVIVPGVTLFAQ